MYLSVLIIVLCSSLVQAYDAVLNCSDSSIPRPSIFGLTITSLTATSYSDFGGIQGNDVCYVTVVTTHGGANDSVNSIVVLPLKGWNARFQGLGGGGWVAGNPLGIQEPPSVGYSVAYTDAGHDISLATVQNATWALLSPGNVNHQGLYDFARRSLHDMTVIGKAISESFYARPVFKSYWNGCSTGGRQGYAMAQYYPELYDGILANAPALYWTALLTYGEYIWSVLTSAGYYSSPCELQAVVDALIADCDELDGLKDGIVQAPGLCKFDANTLLNKTYTCSDNSTNTFSPKIVPIVEKLWTGPRTAEGQFLWFGLTRGASFVGLYSDPQTGFPSNQVQALAIADSWMKGFIFKDYAYNTDNISLSDYPDLFLQAHLEYDSIIGTASPDLRRFKQRGGKIITWQGLADQLVPPSQTILYHQTVAALDCELDEFYRLFFSPGSGHCGGGNGVVPTDQLGQLRAWVENGTAPLTLPATSPTRIGNSTSGNSTSGRTLNLCPYPTVNKYNGKGDPNLASSYDCKQEKGWLTFDGPSNDFNFYTSPGWYGGDSDYAFT